MIIIPDSNALISALVKKGKILELFEWNDFRKEIIFMAPEYLSSEIGRNIAKIKLKSKLSEIELNSILNKIKSQIEFVPFKKFELFVPRAMKISPPNDFPYVALALFLKSLGQNARILSNDKLLLESLLMTDIGGVTMHDLLKEIKLV